MQQILYTYMYMYKNIYNMLWVSQETKLLCLSEWNESCTQQYAIAFRLLSYSSKHVCCCFESFRKGEKSYISYYCMRYAIQKSAYDMEKPFLNKNSPPSLFLSYPAGGENIERIVVIRMNLMNLWLNHRESFQLTFFQKEKNHEMSLPGFSCP